MTGKEFKAWRMTNNLTQADAAALLGVVRETVTRAEQSNEITRGLARQVMAFEHGRIHTIKNITEDKK